MKLILSLYETWRCEMDPIHSSRSFAKLKILGQTIYQEHAGVNGRVAMGIQGVAI
jgi:hypothetical protein